MWNPEYYDIGNYLNEMMCDNAHPQGCGVAHYLRNWPTNNEIESITRQYYLLSKKNEIGNNPDVPVFWSMENSECREAVR